MNPYLRDAPLEIFTVKMFSKGFSKCGKLFSENFIFFFQDEIEILLRKARGILNKLCPQKFDILVTKFQDLQIDTESKLKACMELVFEKVSWFLSV